ncbi:MULTISPECIES: DUF4259 domain-containing protein [unclassified Streptomyces]|uniref:DUF4259 domain-containing protein n=1 Tax=unclassified Streptomyces TaxID=2593676 RepID=UPI002AA2B1C9|nr:DUF4259 domain-containing protein [Streptomyces sp. SHP 1-2]
MITAHRPEEYIMGTWDIGPFENDTAADFAGTLDGTDREGRAEFLRATLQRAAGAVEFLDSPEAEEAVAAAALIAAQCPGGEPVSTGYGPAGALPTFGDDLRRLAADALTRVLSEESELAELWDETSDAAEWREGVLRLRAVLVPGQGAGEEAPSTS